MAPKKAKQAKARQQEPSSPQAKTQQPVDPDSLSNALARLAEAEKRATTAEAKLAVVRTDIARGALIPVTKNEPSADPSKREMASDTDVSIICRGVRYQGRTLRKQTILKADHTHLAATQTSTSRSAVL